MTYLVIALALVALVLLVALVRTDGNARIAKMQAEAREEELNSKLDGALVELYTRDTEYLHLSYDHVELMEEKLLLTAELELAWECVAHYAVELEDAHEDALEDRLARLRAN